MEVMLAVGIAAVLAAMAGAVLKVNVKALFRQEHSYEESGGAAGALERLVELSRRQSVLVLEGEGAGSVKLWGDGGRLLFADSTLAEGQSCDVCYEAAAGRLWAVTGGEYHLLAEGVNSFEVSTSGGGKLLLLRASAGGWDLATAVRVNRKSLLGGGTQP